MLNELFRSWQNVVLHPSSRSFLAERPGADYRKVWVGILIYAVVGAVAVFLGQVISAAMQVALVPALGGGSLDETTLGAGFSLILALVIAVFTFFASLASLWISSGIYWLSSRAFGAQGTYKDQTYLLSLVFVPLGLVSALLSILPFLGAFIAAAVGIYGIVLTVFALQATHEVSGARAFFIWLVPTLIIVGIICICVVISIVLITVGVMGAAGSAGAF
jgi:hypothetical protein